MSKQHDPTNIIQGARDAFLRACGGDEHFWEIESQYALEELRRDAARKNETGRGKKLLECDADSLQDSIVQIARTKLSLSPIKKQANLQSRGGQCRLNPSYRGLIYLATLDGVIRRIDVGVVYEGDTWKYTQFPQHLVHTPGPISKRDKDAKFIAAYCVAYLPDDPMPKIEWMWAEDVYKCRECAKTKTIWTVWFDQMAKKSVIRRAEGTWPPGVSETLGHAMALADDAVGYELNSGEIEDVIVEEPVMPKRKSEANGQAETITVEPETITIEPDEDAEQPRTIKIKNREIITAGVTKETLIQVWGACTKLEKIQKDSAKPRMKELVGVDSSLLLTEAKAQKFLKEVDGQS